MRRIHLFLLAGMLITLAVLGRGAAAAPIPVVAVDSIAAMQALEGGKYPHVTVTGFYAGSIRGGGDFLFQAGSRAVPDGCTVFGDAQNLGRWIRRMGNVLDVTMCGAKWDNNTDDASAISAAFTVASGAGLTVSCPGGTGNVGTTVEPARFTGVVFKCAGMDASTITCTMKPGRPCFLFQNKIGTAAVQAPQIYDVNFAAAVGAQSPSVIIQYNSIAGGFTDTAATQNYMMRPIVQRVIISGGQIAIQCSKCFDGDFSLGTFFNQDRHAFDIEGSDWMNIGDAGTNRITTSGDYPIKLVSHGTFGNGDLVTHNDILIPRTGVGAYIYSSARSAYIEKNYFEGRTEGACEIKIDIGASHAIVRENHVTDRTVKNWLCVVPLLRQAEFSSNITTSHGQGPALFENRGEWKDLLLRHVLVHYGNWTEAGFPYDWTAPFFP